MVWVPPLGFHPYCGGKWLLLQDEFTPSINSKKKNFTKVMSEFWKIKKSNFLENGWADLDELNICYRGYERGSEKNSRTHYVHEKRIKKLSTFLNKFFLNELLLEHPLFYSYVILTFKVTLYILSKIIGEAVHS